MPNSIPHLDSFIQHLTLERRVSDYTVRNYTAAVENFVGWLEEAGKWSEDFGSVQPVMVRSFLVDQGRRLARRTLHNQVSGLRAFCRYLRTQAIVESNPFTGITLPKLDKPLPKFLTETQMTQLRTLGAVYQA